VLLNFGNNFVKSRPTFKNYFTDERELNLRLWDKCGITHLFQLFWKIHNWHKSKILILHNHVQLKLDASGNVTVQQVLIYLHIFCAKYTYPSGPHKCSKKTAPLGNCTVNNALFHTVPNIQQTLLWFSDVVISRLVDALLDNTPDHVVYQVEVRAIWCLTQHIFVSNSIHFKQW
jgi:hypothetical protein